MAHNSLWAALLGLVLAGLLSACASGRPPATFTNPLNTENGSDPWMQYYEGNYYLTTTQWTAIRMWKSPTIDGLKTAEPVTIWTDSTPSRCCNVWAPEFHLLDGPDGKRWYIYYTAGTNGTFDNQRTHVLESSGTDPLGPYTYKGRIYDRTNDGWAIDGSVLKMPDGKLYFLFSSWVADEQSLFIAPMSNPWTISGPRVMISAPLFPWERAVANVNEGPEALYHDGNIFIVYSASACWGPDYKLGMLKYNGGNVLSATSWIKQRAPVFERSDENGVYGPGHNGFFTSPDGAESWIVYHANAAPDDGCVGKRTTRVQQFTWNDDGTPNFGAPVPPGTPIPVPSGERRP
jgi:GH43 family beta-xylosidase